MQDAGCQMLVEDPVFKRGCWVLGIGYWVLVISYWHAQVVGCPAESGITGYMFFRLLTSDLGPLRLPPESPNRSYPLEDRGMAVGQEYLQGMGRQV